jgi:hypothetical protein
LQFKYIANAGIYTIIVLLFNLIANDREGKVYWNQFSGPNGQGVVDAEMISWMRPVNTPHHQLPRAISKIITASVQGVVTVIQVDDKLHVLARNNFGDKIFATPAVAENIIYMRATDHLYALGE